MRIAHWISVGNSDAMLTGFGIFKRVIGLAIQ
jgi:hypothetical protein